MRPATSTTLPAPAPFLKEISLIDTLIELDEVRMFLRDLKLQDGSSFSSPGPFVVRLVRNGSIQDDSFPAFGSHSVPQVSYDQVNLGLKIFTADQIPPELEDDPLVTEALVDHSIVVEGKFKGPLLAPILGQLISFRFVSHQTDGLRIETPNPFLLNSDQETLFVAFKVKTWLDLNLLSLLQNLNLAQLIDALVNGLNLDTQSSDPILKGIALQLEANIDASLRLAWSADSLFDESEVDESSLSFIFP